VCVTGCPAIRLPSITAFASVGLPEEELPDAPDGCRRHQAALKRGLQRTALTAAEAGVPGGCAVWKTAEMATVMSVQGGVFNSRPVRALKTDLTVMLERTSDELPAIQELWPRFERLVGLHGRRMYAMITAKTYAACTPVKDGEDPADLGLATATLPGGWYLQARITGDPPGLDERIGPAMQALEELAAPADTARPLVEYYRRYDVIELWVPVFAQS